MSILIAFKFNDTVVLGTDSRTMDNTGTCILSDAEQKLFEVAPDVFYGWSGYGYLATTQAALAGALGKRAPIEDLRIFAKELDAVSLPVLMQLVNRLTEIRHLHSQYEAELAGTKPFHAYVLAGTSKGRAVYIVHEFWMTEGRIDCREFYRPELPAGENLSMYATRDVFRDMVGKVETWADGPITAAERFVDHTRDVEPLVGGPTQLVCIDKSGARWIHRPAAIDREVMASEVTLGVLNAGVIYSGVVNASQVNAGTFTGFTFVGCTSTLTANGVTVVTDAAYDNDFGSYTGTVVSQTISGQLNKAAINSDVVEVVRLAGATGSGQQNAASLTWAALSIYSNGNLLAALSGYSGGAYTSGQLYLYGPAAGVWVNGVQKV